MPEAEPSTINQATLEALHARLDAIEKRMASVEQAATLFRNLGWVKLGLSAVTAFMIGFFTPLLAVAALVDPPLPTLAWLVALAGGCMGMARDIRGQLELPPVTNGSVTLPERFRKGGTP